MYAAKDSGPTIIGSFNSRFIWMKTISKAGEILLIKDETNKLFHSDFDRNSY